ncbi:hypothetical protein R1sor_013732 [Riccia sorocarpa]|uniref:RRM domain-containing protein n=1 Tax=Riccia sorocarpa TaxID=122646 RepID=A0ABD3H7E8_9MARC
MDRISTKRGHNCGWLPFIIDLVVGSLVGVEVMVYLVEFSSMRAKFIVELVFWRIWALDIRVERGGAGRNCCLLGKEIVVGERACGSEELRKEERGLEMQFRPDVGNGPGLALRRPGGPGPPFAAPPLRGGFPVDYGPRVDDRRFTSQAPTRTALAKGQQQLSDEQDEAPPSRHLWVGNVSQEVTESLLREKFSKYGPIESVTVYSQRNYAFINFKNLENAQDAKNALQGVVLGGLAMRIEFAKGAKPSRHLWVGGIGSTVTREVIESEFKRFGMLEDFKFLRDRNCAFVDYVRIEDAIAAVDSLNRKRLGDEELRVDFGRSQPPKREARPAAVLGDDWGTPRDVRGHSDQFGRVPSDSYRGPPDVFRDSDRGPQASVDIFRAGPEGFQGGMGTPPSGLGTGRNREKEEPSDVLWVGFPLLSKVDEEGLRRAFMPYGEVERVKTFPGRTYAFVQFKNVEEATRAKNALEGKLFNDPRVHIRFSNSEIGPVDNPRTDSLVSPSSGRESGAFTDKNMVNRNAPTERFGSSNPPLRPTGLRPEYYPGGLARGAALARAAAVSGSGLAVGRGSDRGLTPDGRMAVDERSYQTGGQAGRGLPNARPGSRAPYEDGWEIPDDEIVSRESKRMRVLNGGPEVAYPSTYDGGRRFPEGDGFGPIPDTGSGFGSSQARSTGLGDDYMQGPGVPRPRIGSLQFDPPRPSAPAQAQLHSGGPPGPAKRETGAPEVGVVGINEGWRWHGTIAKGGTPVCRARCLPVGKGIDVTVPDVVNCTARTDLDMLAKHVYQAGDFGVVFFVPETDPDVPPYRDFMHYLGEKHRAGVAKLADGTTLFLVPPSEFSERVLKVPGNNCLFGVVLKAPQSVPSQYSQPQAGPPQQLHPPQPLQSQSPQPSSASNAQPYSQSQGRSLSNGLPVQENGAFQGPPPPQGRPPASVAATSNATQSQISSAPGGLPSGLTPELIASLTALLPQQGSGPVPPTSAPPPMSGSNLLPPANGGIGSAGFLGRGDPPSGSAAPSMPTLSSIDNRSNYRPVQGNQPPLITSQGWSSNHSEQPPAGGNHLTNSEQNPGFLPPSQQPPASLPVPPGQPQSLPGGPSSQGQLSFSGSQSQGFPTPVFVGQSLPQQPRPPQHPPPQLGGTPQLPADQLAQLTALLTQRQQQPAQQQQAAQLLQQHYQQQQPPAGHPVPSQPPLPPHQPQTQNYNQQPNLAPQFGQQGPLQPQWGQGHQLPPHGSQNATHPPPSNVNGGGWDHGGVSQGHQHQQQPALPTPQPPSTTLPQVQQHHSSSGSDHGGASNQDEAERQKRFQATLQLAAALLQQMQNQQAPGQSNGDQR